MRQTCGQKRSAISEVAADQHELMIPQRTMRLSIARVIEQLDPSVCMQLEDVSAPQSVTSDLHVKY